MFIAVVFFVFAAVSGSALRDGLWCNTIRFFNMVFAGLVASSLAPGIAAAIRSFSSSRAFFFNFAMLWLVFWVVCGLLQVTTNKLSNVKVKFDPKVNLYGGYVMAFLLACAYTSFAMFTFHQAPLGKNFMFGGFQSDQRMMMGTAPDRQWYTFYSYVGGGAMGGSNEAKSFDEYRAGCDKFRSAVDENVEKTGSTAINVSLN